jgi:hypothetical protein
MADTAPLNKLRLFRKAHLSLAILVSLVLIWSIGLPSPVQAQWVAMSMTNKLVVLVLASFIILTGGFHIPKIM